MKRKDIGAQLVEMAPQRLQCGPLCDTKAAFPLFLEYGKGLCLLRRRFQEGGLGGGLLGFGEERGEACRVWPPLSSFPADKADYVLLAPKGLAGKSFPILLQHGLPSSCWDCDPPVHVLFPPLPVLVASPQDLRKRGASSPSFPDLLPLLLPKSPLLPYELALYPCFLHLASYTVPEDADLGSGMCQGLQFEVY